MRRYQFQDVLVDHARVERAFVKVDAEDGKEEQEEQGDDDDIADVRNRVDQRVDGDLQALVSRDHPQWSQYSQHS